REQEVKNPSPSSGRVDASAASGRVGMTRHAALAPTRRLRRHPPRRRRGILVERGRTMNAPEITTPAMRPYLPVTAKFTSGEDSPRAFLERCLASLDSWEPTIGAFVILNLAAARAAADESTTRWRAGKPLSAIDGMPIGIKDIIETIDMP